MIVVIIMIIVMIVIIVIIVMIVIPLKPKDATACRSLKSLILEVWCLRTSTEKSSRLTPLPLSITSKLSKP